MLHFFKAGPDQLRWDLTAVESGRSYRLAVYHSHGVVVEYFTTAAIAIMRVQELEDPLIHARALDRAPLGLPS